MSELFDSSTKRLLGSALNQPGRDTLSSPLEDTAASANGFRKLDLKLNPNTRVVFHTRPVGLASEQYRLLRRKLLERFPQGATLLVTSPSMADGKTLNTANLAWCLAETPSPTLLMEADLRRPSVAALLGFRADPGVESAFLGGVKPAATVVRISGLSLHVAVVSKAPEDAIRVLRSPGTTKYLEWARSQFRWVLLDAPPVFPSADVAELSPLTDGVLLVVRARSTPRDLTQKSFELLGDRVQGVIYNDATVSLDAPYPY